MNPPQGLASFPGIQNLLAATISLGHGISPSVASLTIAPQQNFSGETGTLQLGFAETLLEFPDCRVDYSSFQRNSSGDLCRLSVVDRRWQWRYGQISGTYNVWRDNFSLQSGDDDGADTERTPQQLATLCLEAMNETGFDVSDMPNESRPSVEWDYDLPAEALATLCDELGCRVVLQLDNRVAIRRVSEGAALDTTGALEWGALVNPPERPQAIAVIGGPNRYQVDFKLEAVGLDHVQSQGGETIVPLNELSYAPTSGWSSADLPYFHQIDAKYKNLAQRSVFRYYRIQMPVEIPGYDGPSGSQVSRREQILPIEDEQVDVATENGQTANLPAAVFGVWYRDVDDVTNSSESLAPAPPPGEGDSPAESIYHGPRSLDLARGLVIFEEPVYQNTHSSASGGSGYEVVLGPAELVLRATCRVRDPETLALARHTRTRTLAGASSAPTRYLRHEEIVLTHRPSYSSSYSSVDVASNVDEVDAKADAFLDAAEQEYETRTPETVRYAGLSPIDLDGAIERISYHVGPEGAFTVASRHDEPPRVAVPHKSRRRIERLADFEDVKARTTPRNLARASKVSPQAKLRPRA